MSVTFHGTYTSNGGSEPVRLARLWITPAGEPTVTVQADDGGTYSYVSTSTKERFTIVEQFGPRRTYDVNAATGGTVDTSFDVGAVLVDPFDDPDSEPAPDPDRGWFTNDGGVRTLFPTPEEE